MTGQRRGHANKGAGRRRGEMRPPAHMPEVHCPTGKVAIRRSDQLPGIASAFARELNAAGEYAPDLYGYPCKRCKHFHLTKLAAFEGHTNVLCHRAAPRELQEWAMPGGAPTRT